VSGLPESIASLSVFLYFYSAKLQKRYERTIEKTFFFMIEWLGTLFAADFMNKK
jgi:hypothetical protein